MCVHWRIGYGKLQSKRFLPPRLLTLAASYGIEQQHQQPRVGTPSCTGSATTVAAVRHNGQGVSSPNAIANALVDVTMHILLPHASAAHSRGTCDTVTRVALSAVSFTPTPILSSNVAGSACMRPIASFFSSCSPTGAAAPAPPADTGVEGSASNGSVRTPRSTQAGGNRAALGPKPTFGVHKQQAYLQEIDSKILSELPMEIQQEMRRAMHGSGSGKRRRIDDFFSRR